MTTAIDTILFKANTRGRADFGWLKSNHTFSFGHYFNPDRVNFGALRVLNDDIIAPGTGFGLHPHRDMEIISIPIKGKLAHTDTKGHKETIGEGEVQVMTAGKGISHSEYNHSQAEDAHFLQIWIIPRALGLPPAYSQKAFDLNGNINRLNVVASGLADEGALVINQDARLSLGHFNSPTSVTYKPHNAEKGVFIMVIEGEATVGEHLLEKRDALGIANQAEITIQANADTKLLVIEVPMIVLN